MPLYGEYTKFCVKVTGFDKNSVADTTLTIPNGATKYVITEVLETNTSGSQASSASTLAIYTAVSAGGTAIVSPATATELTTSAKTKSYTINTTDTRTASSLYLRNTVAHGTTMTSDVYVFGLLLA